MRASERKAQANLLGFQQDTQGYTLKDFRWMGSAACDIFFSLVTHAEYSGSTKGAVLLPPITQSVSDTPTCAASLVKVYPHGLEFGDEGFSGEGVLAFFGFLGLCFIFGLPPLFGKPWYFYFIDGWGFAIAWGLMGLISWLSFKSEFKGYYYYPKLFDRAAGKVSIFSNGYRPGTAKRQPLYKWPHLLAYGLLREALDLRLGGGPHYIDTVDWNCVRAEIYRARETSRIASFEVARMRLVVTDKPGSMKVVNTFGGIDVSVPDNAVQLLLDSWEHVRRFMQHEGPLLGEKDAVNKRIGKLPLWQSLCYLQVLVGPGAMEFWRKGGWLEISGGILLLLASWFSVPIGFLRWFTTLFKSTPKWPTEILASAGGAELKGKDLDAWRNIVPSKPTSTQPQDPSAEFR